MKDYKKIDPKNKLKEYDLGVLFIVKNDGTKIDDEELLFNYIPLKAKDTYTREELITGERDLEIKPVNKKLLT